jgi:hypothetical protein
VAKIGLRYIKNIRGVGNDGQLDFGCCQTCKGQSGSVWFMDLESEVWGRGVRLSPARKAGSGVGGEKGEGSREKQGGKTSIVGPHGRWKKFTISSGIPGLG